jgi:Short C-terminal domain
MRSRIPAAIFLLVVCYGSPNVSGACDPDLSSVDKISKKPVVRWRRHLTEVGFWKSMVVSDIDVIAVIGRYGDINALNIQIVNKENDRDRAAFDSRYKAAIGDRFIFGFKDVEPLTFVATKANNEAQIQAGKGLVMTVVLSARLTDSELAKYRAVLTTKPIDAVRIALSSGVIERSIAEEHGTALMEKFTCFFAYLDGRGITLSAGADQPNAPSQESPETRLQKLKDLFDKGLISKDEYESKRAEILKAM